MADNLPDLPDLHDEAIIQRLVDADRVTLTYTLGELERRRRGEPSGVLLWLAGTAIDELRDRTDWRSPYSRGDV